MVDELGKLEGQQVAHRCRLAAGGSQLENAGNLSALVDLQVRKKSLESGRNYIIEQERQLHNKIGRLPAVAADYARLERNIAVYSKTFEILNQQYQLERITQKGEDGDYQIVDRAQPDPKPVAPRKSTNAAVGGVPCSCSQLP